ncbi:MAG: formylglycine-generating enzyme family protein [Gammaproteobacteria bacterium]
MFINFNCHISKDAINRYLGWLSEKTQQHYRLPTAREWRYAANADGLQPLKDVNCRVVQQGEVIIGEAIQPVDRGKANGWGVYNYLGNVQELATDGGQLVALGGSYSNSPDECEISYQLPHLGSADSITGFRVLREL